MDIPAPPAPPPPAFDAALLWNGGRYYKQIVAGLSEDVSVEHVWNIQLLYAENNLINITWDNTGWSELGTFVLQDAFGGNLLNVDMTTVDSLVLDNPEINILKLTRKKLITAGRDLIYNKGIENISIDKVISGRCLIK